MTTTFISKVEAQRRILNIVNRHPKIQEKLSGLSLPAINDWTIKCQIMPKQPIFNTLLELSDLCQLLSDRSHETFQQLPQELLSKLESGIHQLKCDIATLQA